MNLHLVVWTTPWIREEIHHAKGMTQEALAKKYNVSVDTIRKWQNRDVFTDESHRPDTLQVSLSEIQEAILVELRKTLFLPLNDWLVLTREFIYPNASRAGLHRTLKHHGVSSLNHMRKALDESTDSKSSKTLKDYAPSFIHEDIKYLSQMPDETQRSYLFVAIDLASRWVYFAIYSDKRADTAQRFLQDVIEKAPFAISKVLTDRFTPNGERKPMVNHLFDQLCQKQTIEHRLIRPAHPQTNGMVERFNGRISGTLKQTTFASAKELAETLKYY